MDRTTSVCPVCSVCHECGHGLQQELQSTLAALEELGPGYEPQARAMLLERLHAVPAGHGSIRREQDSQPWLGRGVAIALAAGVLPALLLASAAFGSTSHRYGRAAWYHEHYLWSHHFRERLGGSVLVSPNAPGTAPVAAPSPVNPAGAGDQSPQIQ